MACALSTHWNIIGPVSILLLAGELSESFLNNNFAWAW